MPIFHINASVIHKTHSNPGAAGFARYLTREDVSHAEAMQAYVERDGRTQDDLVEKGEASLPRWAQDGAHFFTMANRYELRKDSVVARHYQISLPRELSPAQRAELAADIREVFFAHHPHIWAIHNPQARDGSGEQPHVHILFSPRRVESGRAETAQAWFASQDRARVDRTWQSKQALQGLRYEAAILINAALERAGIEAAVSAQKIRVQSDGRSAGLHYEVDKGDALRRAAIRDAQQQLHRSGVYDAEQLIHLHAWYLQKERERIKDISREALVDHCRDRFWQHDQSPRRQAEREASLERAIAREFTYVGRERGQRRHHDKDQVLTVEHVRLPVPVRHPIQEHAYAHAREDTQHEHRHEARHPEQTPTRQRIPGGQGTHDRMTHGAHVELDRDR